MGRYDLASALTIDCQIHSLFAPGQFAPRSKSTNRTLANWLPGTFAPWPFRSVAFSLPDLFAPWPSRSLELSLPGAKWPGNETFALKSIRSQEHSLPGTFIPR